MNHVARSLYASLLAVEDAVGLFYGDANTEAWARGEPPSKDAQFAAAVQLMVMHTATLDSDRRRDAVMQTCDAIAIWGDNIGGEIYKSRRQIEDIRHSLARLADTLASDE